ncbi:MAG: histidine phosphatase family protein [Bacillota bacterium]|nr:histidine phosphatase family protein [Bacillota bacterium]
MKSYYIHLIRHGITSEGKKGAYIGSTDSPLCEEGITALKNITEKYDYPCVPIVLTSPMLRCVQTCNLIYPDIKPQAEENLRECSFGRFEGKTAAELKDDPEFSLWLANSQQTTPTGGESGADFTKRICLCFEKIVNNLLKSGETQSAIITHGGVIMTLLAIYGLPMAKPFEWQMDSGFGYSLRITPSLWMRDKVCEVCGLIPFEKEPEEDDDES